MRNRITPALDNGRVRALLPTALFGLLTLARPAEAQEVFMPRPEFSVAPPAVQQSQANEMDVFVPAGAVSGGQQEKPPFRWGPVTLRPHMFYRFLYADGLPSGGTNHTASAIQDISPGFLFGIGSHWTLDYVPTWRLYSSRQFRDTLDHDVRLTGWTAYEDWVFGLSQGFVSSSMPLVETGTQTDQKIYSTAIKASYRLNSKMSLDLTLDQNFMLSDGFQSSRQWSTLDWLNYQFWLRLDAAIGAGFGYVNVDTGSDMAYEQLQGRVSWRATDKISFRVHAGLEDRQFLSSAAGDLINPVAGGAIQYQPFETTRISLSADRVVTTSLLTVSSSQTQVIESTDVNGVLNQRLLKRLYLDLGVGYHTGTFVASSADPAGRRDEFYSFNVRVYMSFLKRGTAAAFCQISDNSSTAAGSTFSTSQFGCELGYRF